MKRFLSWLFTTRFSFADAAVLTNVALAMDWMGRAGVNLGLNVLAGSWACVWWALMSTWGERRYAPRSKPAEETLTIRVQADTTQARAELAQLYAEVEELHACLKEVRGE